MSEPLRIEEIRKALLRLGKACWDKTIPASEIRAALATAHGAIDELAKLREEAKALRGDFEEKVTHE